MAKRVVEATPEVLDTLRKARILVNKGNDGVQGIDGTTLPDDTQELIPANTQVPAKVKSGNGIVGYTCDIYGNGLTQLPTSEGLVFLTNGASSLYTLPVGTVLFVQAMDVSLMRKWRMIE